MTNWRKNLSFSLTTALVFSTSLAFAEEIKTNTAIMQAMDKITGRVKVIEVPVSGNVDFGTFSIVVRDCQTRPPEETPENFAFVDIVDNNIDGSKENIFKGWMMSSTPALNAVEHPIYDVWLLRCSDTNVDKSKLLSAEQLAERDAVAKKVSEDNKLKDDFEETDLTAPVSETTEKVVDEKIIQEEIPEVKTEVIPEEEIIKENENAIENDIVVKELLSNEETLTQPAPELPVATREGMPAPILPEQPTLGSESPIQTSTEQPVMHSEELSTVSTETDDTTQNKENSDDFYDEFDSLIQE